MATLKSRLDLDKILIYACRNGQLAQLESELSNQSNASIAQIFNTIRTNADETLLHLAAAGNGDKNDVTKYLLQHGADANARGYRNQAKTALHEAARVGHTRICASLLEGGAHVNAVKSGDWTPLMIAVAGGHQDVVELLLKAGANSTQVNREGATALHLACRYGCERCVKMLVSNKSRLIMTRSRNLRTPLHYAARANRFRVCQLLCENGADIAALDISGCSAAHEAAEHSELEVLRLLVHDKAWEPDCGGLNILHYAAIGGCKDVVLFLLNTLKNFTRTHSVQKFINMPTSHNLTPLALAMLNNHPDVVRLLLSHGATVRDEWNQICQSKGFYECVKAVQSNAVI